MLYDIRARRWDPELSEMLGVPIEMLPEVRDSSGSFGETEKKLLGAAVPIAGIAGDQQAATFGQGCFRAGMAKSTYGTGAFILMNTGHEAVASRSGLLTTVGWSIDGEVTYCLEGSVFIAGAAVQWLRDGLGLIRRSADVEKLAASVADSGGVMMVPAFVGLGTPHWDPYARGLLIGLERSTTAAHVARATVESMAYQVRDVVTAMESDSGVRLRELRVDGGASVNAALMQFQADLLGRIVRRPVVAETTALGAAYLAGLAVGFWKNTQDVTRNWALDAEFRPALGAAKRDKLVARWRKAVERAKGWAES
jgi:glycerol kinase